MSAVFMPIRNAGGKVLGWGRCCSVVDVVHLMRLLLLVLLAALPSTGGAAEGGAAIGTFLDRPDGDRPRMEGDSGIVWEAIKRRIVLVEDQAEVEFSFPFTVSQGVKARIAEATTGCGCATPVFDGSELGGGAASTVRVTYHVGSSFGEQRKTVRVSAVVDGSPKQFSLDMIIDVPRIFQPFGDTIGYSLADVREARRTGAKRIVSMQYVNQVVRTVELANPHELQLFSAALKVSDAGVIVSVAPREVQFPEVKETQAEKIDVRLTYPNGQSRIQRVWILLYK